MDRGARLQVIEAAGQITRKYPKVGVVMLSLHSDETYVLRCLRTGARGYVLKESRATIRRWAAP